MKWRGAGKGQGVSGAMQQVGITVTATDVAIGQAKTQQGLKGSCSDSKASRQDRDSRNACVESGSGILGQKGGPAMLLKWSPPGKRTFIHQRTLKAGNVHTGGKDEWDRDERTARAPGLSTKSAKGPVKVL